MSLVLMTIYADMSKTCMATLSSDGQTDGQTESDAYEPTMQWAQVGSKLKQ